VVWLAAVAVIVVVASVVIGVAGRQIRPEAAVGASPLALSAPARSARAATPSATSPAAPTTAPTAAPTVTVSAPSPRTSMLTPTTLVVPSADAPTGSARSAPATVGSDPTGSDPTGSDPADSATVAADSGLWAIRAGGGQVQARCSGRRVQAFALVSDGWQARMQRSDPYRVDVVLSRAGWASVQVAVICRQGSPVFRQFRPDGPQPDPTRADTRAGRSADRFGCSDRACRIAVR